MGARKILSESPINSFAYTHTRARSYFLAAHGCALLKDEDVYEARCRRCRSRGCPFFARARVYDSSSFPRVYIYRERERERESVVEQKDYSYGASVFSLGGGRRLSDRQRSD